ncbi:MAG TPA: hypothetical protein RMH99_19895 [Sandaracinaceae bacterium LLY-WYZ-13_1]|nr:hypothetical protein [Sandaracinaceae bacterium LLY-WYZ-13_1]
MALPMRWWLRASSGLILLACAGGGATASAPRAEPSAPRVLGLTLTAELDDVRRSQPQLAFRAASPGEVVAEGAVEHGRRSFRVRLAFHEGRLAQISAHLTGATIEGYEALSAELATELGPGEPTICTSETGSPLPAYLASGRGEMRREWQHERVRASVALYPLSDGRLQLGLDLEDRAVADRRREEMDFEGAGKQARSACPELGPSPPRALGVELGVSPDAARRAFGTDAALERPGVAVPHRVAGIAGEMHLDFYDGCLAVLTFRAPGTVASYRALQRALVTELGAPERRERCSPTGEAPTDAEVAAQRGSFQTRFDGPVLEGAVRLSTVSPREGPLVIVEISSLALRPRAPGIAFGEE